MNVTVTFTEYHVKEQSLSDALWEFHSTFILGVVSLLKYTVENKAITRGHF